MDERVRAWLTEQVGATRAWRRTLVLCRSRATAALVRRWLAHEGGRLGVEIALPTTVAAQLRPRTLFVGAEERTDDPTLPADSEMGRRAAGRPGLTAVARRWVQHTRAARAAGADVVAPTWLEELVGRGWAFDDDHAALVEVFASGRIALAREAWDRVAAVGFWDEPGVSPPWEDRLAVDLVGGPLPSPPEEHTGALSAVLVPDVSAEARLAVSEAARDPSGTLILCAHVATARRARDALARSGIACAWRDTDPLSSHEVASAVRRAAAWFAEAVHGDPPVQADDLAFVLARVGLGDPHPALAAFVAARLAAAGVEAVHVTRSLLDDVVRHARLVDAPLSAWLARLAGVAAGICTEQHPARLARLKAGAIAVRARLLVLKAALERRALTRVLEDDAGVALSFDPDDFDQVIAQLLGDDALRGPLLPLGTTLGALHRFLVESRLRVHDDPVAQAILGSLGRRADWPAGPAWVHQALGGAHDPGILGDGVDVLLADDWDGRPCRTLLLLDVHDHGLARHARPDPLLTDDEIGRLGTLPVRRQVERRLAQVRRATARAERTVAIVSERDASGREVVPPVLLDLDWPVPPPVIPSYGLRLSDVPELAPLAALEVDAGPASPSSDAPWEIRHLATQATAEWVREGRGPSVAPAFVWPYVGDAHEAPEAALPAREHSVSTLLAPLSKCGFRAFASVVLGLREEEELKSELDPREVGSAVHAALEQASAAIAWRTMGDDGPERALATLRGATDRAFAEAIARLGAPSPAHAAAADGLRARWNVHWDSYVASRLLRPTTKGVDDEVLRDHPDVIGAEGQFRDRVPGGEALPWWLVRDWLLEHAGRDPQEPDEATIVQARGNPVSCEPDALRAFLAEPAIRRLGQSLRQARLARALLLGKVERMVVATELGFGSRAEPSTLATPDGGIEVHLPDVKLQLGRDPLAVRGQIDRVEWITTSDARGAAVIDFKTGTSRFEGWRFRRELLAGLDPQLLVYAMVLERARKDELLPEPLRMPVALVAHDRVWMTRKAGDEVTLEQPDTVLPIDLGLLRAAAATLGELVDQTRDGRWWLRPREQACPHLSQWAFSCPAAASCRLRALSTEPS